MSNIENMFKPKILTLITTHKCGSYCSSCCFNCSPQRKECMELSDAYRYIDVFIAKYPSIEIVVLTGGEVMLMGVDWVSSILLHIKKKGVKSRIVTNAFWANTREQTRLILDRLSASGLNEINVSTGDEHLKFVPIDHVINLLEETEKNKLIENSAVVIESGIDKKYTVRCLLEDLDRAVGIDKLIKLKVLESPWVALEGKNIFFQGEEIVDISSNETLSRGCYSLYSGIQINPNGQLLSCCGFASEYSPLLKIGNALEMSKIEGEIEKMEINNILKLWLYVDGPRGVFEYFNPRKSIAGCIHDCEVCTRLIMNTEYLFKISQISPSKVKDIIYRAMFKLENKIQ